MKLKLRQKLIQEGIMDGLQLYIQNKYNDLKNFIETDKIKEQIELNAKVPNNTEDNKEGTIDASLPNVG